MEYTNEMKLEFDSRSQNESFARVCVAAFITQLDPNIEEITDVKTAVSEAVTNAIIHGYENKINKVYIHCVITGKLIEIEVIDSGVGIANIEEAKEPLYTSKPELERSGMGFTFMESFMDEVEIISELGKGTTVRMKKTIGGTDQEK